MKGRGDVAFGRVTSMSRWDFVVSHLLIHVRLEGGGGGRNYSRRDHGLAPRTRPIEIATELSCTSVGFYFIFPSSKKKSTYREKSTNLVCVSDDDDVDDGKVVSRSGLNGRMIYGYGRNRTATRAV